MADEEQVAQRCLGSEGVIGSLVIYDHRKVRINIGEEKTEKEWEVTPDSRFEPCVEVRSAFCILSILVD